MRNVLDTILLEAHGESRREKMTLIPFCSTQEWPGLRLDELLVALCSVRN